MTFACSSEGASVSERISSQVLFRLESLYNRENSGDGIIPEEEHISLDDIVNSTHDSLSLNIRPFSGRSVSKESVAMQWCRIATTDKYNVSMRIAWEGFGAGI